jgi:hypothetical protein
MAETIKLLTKESFVFVLEQKDWYKGIRRDNISCLRQVLSHPLSRNIRQLGIC